MPSSQTGESIGRGGQTGESLGRTIQAIRLLSSNRHRRVNLLESSTGRARRISLPHHIN